MKILIKQIAATFIGGVVISSAVNAQDIEASNSNSGNASQLEEIVVTGSYLKRKSQSDLPSPTYSMTADDMNAQGFRGSQDITQNLTFANGSINSPNLLADNSGIHTSVNLRGLGDASTLVLFNGKRVATTAVDRINNFYVDVRTLVPSIALQRMDIVLDGAAALYGSDAIAGVVNVVTDREFEGAKVDAQYNSVSGTSGGSDIQLMFGTAVNDRLHATAAFGFRRDGLLTNGDRGEFAVPPETISSNGQPGTFRLSSRPVGANGGDLIIDNGVSGPINYSQLFDDNIGTADNLLVADPNCPVAGTGGQPRDAFPLDRCTFNYHRDNTLRPSTDQFLGYSSFTYELSERQTLNVDLSFYDAEHDRSFVSSFPVVRGEAVIPASNPFNVFGVDAGFVGRPFGLNAPAARTRYDQSGYRVFADLSGDFADTDDWSYVVSFQHSQAREVENTEDVDILALQTALNGFGGSGCVAPIAQGATPSGVTPGTGNTGTGNCYYFSPFASEQLTNPEELRDFIIGSAGGTVTQEVSAIDAVVSGLIDVGLEVGVAVGVHARQESYDQIYTGLRESGRGGFLGLSTNGNAERTVTALFTEFSIPFTDELEMQVAARYEDYERFTTTDPKVAVLWSPTDFATVRASWGTAFRAPSLIQSLGTQTSTLLQDIVDTSQPNPVSLFVPIVSANNPNLTPEESTNYNLGATFEIGESTTFNIDYWNYRFEEFITTESAQAKVNSDPFGPDVIRGSNGEILQVNTGFFNSGGLTTSGVDLRLDYSAPLADGDFFAKLSATTILEYDIQALAGGASIDGVGKRNLGFGRAAPEWKSNLMLGYAVENHSGNLTFRYVDGLEDANGGQIDSHMTVDAQYSYDFGSGDQYTLAVGALNLLDEAPPRAFAGFAPELHDGLLRQVYARFSAEF